MCPPRQIMPIPNSRATQTFVPFTAGSSPSPNATSEFIVYFIVQGWVPPSKLMWDCLWWSFLLSSMCSDVHNASPSSSSMESIPAADTSSPSSSGALALDLFFTFHVFVICLLFLVEILFISCTRSAVLYSCLNVLYSVNEFCMTWSIIGSFVCSIPTFVSITLHEYFTCALGIFYVDVHELWMSDTYSTT